MIRALLLLFVVTAAQAEEPPQYVRHFGRHGTNPGSMRVPGGVTSDAQGNIYVAEIFGHRVQKFDSLGNSLALWGGRGRQPGKMSAPSDVVVDGQERLWVADRDNHRLQWFTLDGEFLGAFGDTARSQFDGPSGLGLDPNGPDLFVADTNNHRIRKLDISGEFPVPLLSFGEFGMEPGMFAFPMDVSISTTGRIHTVELSTNRVQIFSPEGLFRRAFGEIGSEPGTFAGPVGIAVDSADRIYVVDTFNGRVQKFEHGGTFILQWGRTGRKAEVLNRPTRMSLTGDGLVLVCDAPGEILDTNRIVVYRLDASTAVESRSWSDLRRTYRRR